MNLTIDSGVKCAGVFILGPLFCYALYRSAKVYFQWKSILPDKEKFKVHITKALTKADNSKIKEYQKFLDKHLELIQSPEGSLKKSESEDIVYFEEPCYLEYKFNNEYYNIYIVSDLFINPLDSTYDWNVLNMVLDAYLIKKSTKDNGNGNDKIEKVKVYDLIRRHQGPTNDFYNSFTGVSTNVFDIFSGPFYNGSKISILDYHELEIHILLKSVTKELTLDLDLHDFFD